MLLHRTFILFFLCFLSSTLQAVVLGDYLPEEADVNDKISTPKETLGFEIGERHLRYDQLKHFFFTLEKQSPRIKTTSIGYTSQRREQILVTISSAKNLENIDKILAKRHLPFKNENTQAIDDPLVIWLGYSVHGDEISGANASMVVAYYLAASQEKNISEMLENTIIVLEPSINPDGMDRFVNWVTNYRGSSFNDDPNHIEHHQSWITGRTNHFWFDLNRDWLLLSQQESQNRLKYFHLYQPNVLGDYHEMYPNSSYFFQPGVTSRTHPLTPLKNTQLTHKLAQYHAEALDKHQRLYYSGENFDDFYYGKGSTYPDINAAIGILFEQASSRGMQQQTENGLLTFEYGIKNHILTSLSTIKGAWDNRVSLKEYRQNFYTQAIKQAKKEKFNGYLIRESKDKYRLNAFLDKLYQHQIEVYSLKENFRFQDENFSKENSFYIPIAQAQYRVIQALFNQDTNFKDNTFYDVSGWTMPLAMNIEFHKVNRTWGLELAGTAWSPEQSLNGNSKSLMTDAYAYIFDWHQFLAPKLLNTLLSNKIKAKVATKPFSSVVDGKSRNFSRGSIVIPAGLQQQKGWKKLLANTSEKIGVEVFSVSTGLTPIGIDLGSNSFQMLHPVKTLLLGGDGISQYEAGEIRFYLDKTLGIPISVIDHTRLLNINLSVYSHIILVDGNYNKISNDVAIKLQKWVKQGGVIIGQKRGAKWLSDKEMLTVDFVTKEKINEMFDSEYLRYQDKEALAARKRIAGAIFQTELDITHPLAYGYSKPELPLFRNSTLIMEQFNHPFVTIAKYSEKPLMSGYSDQNLVNRLAHNAAIVAHNLGKGRVIASTDVLAFRGYWLGSAKLLANSLFFAKTFNTPIKK